MMATARYDKSSPMPQGDVGERRMKDGWNDPIKDHYPATGPARLSTHKSKMKHSEGGQGSPNGQDYPNSRERFGTHRGV